MAVYKITIEQFVPTSEDRYRNTKDVLEYSFASPGMDGPEIIKILEALPHYDPVSFVPDRPAVDIADEMHPTVAAMKKEDETNKKQPPLEKTEAARGEGE